MDSGRKRGKHLAPSGPDPGGSGAETSEMVRRRAVEMTASERRLWVGVLAFLLLDLATTAYGLHLGFDESNPIAIALLWEFGFWALVSLKLGSVGIGVVGWVVLPIWYRFIAPVTLAAAWAIGSTLNMFVIICLMTP